MRLVIVGGGEIGSQIADALQNSHDITILDSDPDRARSFEGMDVQFVTGSGTDPNDLRKAGAHKARAFIACTLNDDINVIACLAAKGMGAKETMAFVTRERYVQAFQTHGAFESVGLIIDRILWPQKTLADQIANIVRVPRAIDSASFANGRLRMLEYRLEPGDPFTGQTLAAIELPPSVLVVGSIRDESFLIPRGNTVLEPDDKVIFMGTQDSMRALERRFAPRRRHTNVVIVGGGNVGFMVAQELQAERAHVTIIEEDEARCVKLAEWLPKALILRGDGTDLELLEQERVEDADVLLAVTNDDGKNLLASLLGKQLGVPKVITRVGYSRNRHTFQRVGIDTALTPRSAAVQEVLNWLHVDEVDHLKSIEDRAEIIDVIYPDHREPRMVMEMSPPPKTLIGGVLRGDQVIVPRGDTRIQAGDHLYIVTTPENVEAVHHWLELERS